MARPALQMAAIAQEIARKACDGCGRLFREGEQMTAMEYDDASPAGWHCTHCMARYTRWGLFDPDRARREHRYWPKTRVGPGKAGEWTHESGWLILRTGHPTALRPYAVIAPDGRIVNKVRLLKQAFEEANAQMGKE